MAGADGSGGLADSGDILVADPLRESDHNSRNEPPTIGILASPLLWGAALTAGFYALIPYLPVHGDLARRYFCSHPLEYVTTALFFVGITLLAAKGLRLGRQKAALAAWSSFEGRESQESGVWGQGSGAGRQTPNPQPSTLNPQPIHHSPTHPRQQAELAGATLARLPARLQRTWLAERIRDVCAFVRGRGTADGLDEHLKYLADQAGERLHESYAPVRTITWAVPILGFLGTVIGITIAVANVTPEQLDSSLGAVTGGLAVAFDTTALALALSLVLVFCSFPVERAEQRILADVEEFAVKRLAPMFAGPEIDRRPLADAEARAARYLLEKTESLINWQSELWRTNLEALRQRWSETLAAHTDELQQALRAGVSATLEDHAGQLQEMRGEFLEAFRGQHAYLERFADAVAQRVAGWQQQLAESTTAAGKQLAELCRHGDTLLRLTEGQEHLAHLQSQLTANLEAVRAAGDFEETLHSLSAAVHLLTARTRPQAA